MILPGLLGPVARGYESVVERRGLGLVACPPGEPAICHVQIPIAKKRPRIFVLPLPLTGAYPKIVVLTHPLRIRFDVSNKGLQRALEVIAKQSLPGNPLVVCDKSRNIAAVHLTEPDGDDSLVRLLCDPDFLPTVGSEVRASGETRNRNTALRVIPSSRSRRQLPPPGIDS